ncbi:hypothetical protein HMPREF9418_1414 [Neisseria macacae ATCC 33926]|uniref:Uncharacterized protein n=1 Tax=Neisseria macacae ATCC 33926 TaxID=997348 RepID=A0AA36UJ66_9NEIS|nr:hypothetical protein HMPREF9418_1414 [Neisseria macacae ATCC 33926]
MSGFNMGFPLFCVCCEDGLLLYQVLPSPNLYLGFQTTCSSHR